MHLNYVNANLTIPTKKVEEEKASVEASHSPLSDTAELLKKEGVSSMHLQPALLIIVALVSAHLGTPLAVLLASETETIAVDLLHLCSQFVPKEMILELSKATSKVLYCGGKQLKGKSILSFNLSGLLGALPDIKVLILRSIMKNNVISPLKNSTGLTEETVEGPISWVLIAEHDFLKKNTEPFSINILLNEDGTFELERTRFLAEKAAGNVTDLADIEIDKKIFAKRLQVTKQMEVRIPFALDLMEQLNTRGFRRTEDFELLTKIVKLLALINNPPRYDQKDMMAECLGIEPDKLERYLTNHSADGRDLMSFPKTANIPVLPGNGQDNQDVATNTITATKADYYYARLLLDGLLNTSSDELSGRQQRIFEAVKKFNIDSVLNGSFIPTSGSEKEIMEALEYSESIRTWADRNKIQAMVNADGGEDITFSTLNLELKALIKKDFVRSKPVPYRNKLVYAVTTFHAGSTLVLPDPSSIIDPIYNGAPVKVLNFLTGQEETI